ncbi:uncharacterized protein N7477_000411 [Penicillium maclennaniae]|uniref:uncharacterized protein n=1 Tax=Penicillium maclennaniae TaxID=1343394 RepID=UPI002541A1DD|nr:uncharacterized protein N7477_000411 [Penicillium maclennaniae]KAJ5684066.1 hypothetical protein N7477_000411 [Penicillium maclennaniae]
MTLNLDSEDVLYTLACECEGLFDQLQETLLKTKLEVSTMDLFAEFQQRFSIWAAHLGVFARKSQCLDTRLRNLPDLQDLVARLLDILRRSLQQCKNETNSQEEVDQAPIGFDESHRKASIQTAALTAIDNTLSRLNRLGVTIRRSSRDNIDTRAKIFAAALNLDSFAYLCAKAVHALYPCAHQSLKDYLSKSMTDRYAKMLFLNSRHKKLETRREPRLGLSPILEVPNDETQTNVPMTQPARAIPVVANLPKAFAALSQSDLSSVNIQQIRRRLRPPDEASTLHKTTSVQVNQGKYPRPPVANADSDIFACEWCFELLSKKTLSESEWW